MVLIIVVSILDSCKKDGSGEAMNTIKITDGEFNGYSHTFTPNMGFWSPANETTQYIHLVLGTDNNQATTGENIMTLVFYDTGAGFVQFPSPEGQLIEFGINFNGTVYYFREDQAELTIVRNDGMNFEGSLSGQFTDINDISRKISFSMHLSLPMQEI